MARAIYWQRGDVIDYTNGSDKAISAGAIVTLGTRVGVAATDIPAKSVGSVAVEGVYVMPKAATVDIKTGDKLYYNSTNDNIDTTDSGVLVGYATADAAAADAEVYVKLQG